MVSVPISIGELIDKWTILQIKANNIEDKEKLDNVMAELEELNNVVSPYLYGEHRESMSELVRRLTDINEALWDIEDEIRDLEHKKIPQQLLDDIFVGYFVFVNDNPLDNSDTESYCRFVELARMVYITNDQRSKVKKEINQLLGSGIIEEKSYKEY